MYRRLITAIATVALLTATSAKALADPPVVSSAVRPDASDPRASGSATVPTDANTPVADLHMSDPVTATTGTGSSGTASSSGTSVSGPGTSVSAPARASRGSGTPGTPDPSTEPPTASHHASTPTDTSGTAIGRDDQNVAVRSSGTSAGGSVSDPTSADTIAAFCFLAHANEAGGRPTANVSSVCGDQPSTAGGSAASDEAGAGTADGGLGGSLCVNGAADGGTPARASLGTACGSSPTTAGGAGDGAGSEGTTITPAMRASVVIGLTGSMAQNETVPGTGVQILPFTSTASAPTIAGLLLVASAMALSFLLKRKRV